jgi:uncharacterized protein with PIN domain
MNIYDVHSNTGVTMAPQNANPVVVKKVELMAKRLGLSKTAVVERALDQLMSASELDFGDVFGHALAKVRGLPLLHTGADFSETDIASAAPR